MEFGGVLDSQDLKHFWDENPHLQNYGDVPFILGRSIRIKGSSVY